MDLIKISDEAADLSREDRDAIARVQQVRPVSSLLPSAQFGDDALQGFRQGFQLREREIAAVDIQ